MTKCFIKKNLRIIAYILYLIVPANYTGQLQPMEYGHFSQQSRKVFSQVKICWLVLRSAVRTIKQFADKLE